MFDHVTIRVSDRAASERFYDTVLAVLAHRPRRVDRVGRLLDRRRRRPVTRRLHIAFYAPPHALVDAFHQAGVDAGFAPTARPAHATTRPSTTARSCWTRTATASRPSRSRTTARSARSTTCGCARATSAAIATFYEALAPVLGVEVERRSPEHTYVEGDGGSFSFIQGEPTEHVHIAFAARDERRPSTPSTPPPPPPATPTTALPASARSTTPATTAPSCSTPTATTSRPSTTTAEQRPPRLDLGVVDEVVHALEDVDARRPRRAPRAPTRSPAPASAGTQPSGSDVPM